MITINIDNLMAFYIIMAILFLGFAIIVTFGETVENKQLKRNKRTTTS